LFETEAKRKRAVVRAVEKVTKHLGNTPAICRRCYIHPAIFDGHLDGTPFNTLKEQTQTYLAQNVSGMSAEEAAVTAFLRLRLGELESQQKETSSSAGNGRNNCGRLQHADRARSSELLQNQLNGDDRDNWRSALGAVDLLV
jgi:DNA topoisomerase-1